MRTACSLFLALFAASCARSPIPGEVPSTARPVFVAKIWVQDDPHMPKDLVLDGCALWAPVGVACRLVDKPADAHVRFLPMKDPCVATRRSKSAAPKVTIATAHSDGHVEMHVNCIVGADGKLDKTKFATVVGHELGHELGIWDHVPLECDDRDQKYVTLSSGEKLCGEAMMNPDYDDDVTELTDMDGHAFSHRDKVYSIFRPVDLGPPPSRPEIICTYGGSAPPTD